MTKNKAKNEGIGTLLEYLDREIELFRQKTGNYPKKIILSRLACEKVFFELELEPIMDNCWKDKQDNYRGISIYIKENVFIELE